MSAVQELVPGTSAASGRTPFPLLHQGQPGYVGGGGSSFLHSRGGGRHEEHFHYRKGKRSKESLRNLSAVQELGPGTPAA